MTCKQFKTFKYANRHIRNGKALEKNGNLVIKERRQAGQRVVVPNSHLK